MCLDEFGCGPAPVTRRAAMWIRDQGVVRSMSPVVTVMTDPPLQAVSNTQCVCSCAWLGESVITKVIAGVSAFGNLLGICYTLVRLYKKYCKKTAEPTQEEEQNSDNDLIEIMNR